MPWELLLSVLDDLSAHSYVGWLAFHNFNEPLANPRLVDEIVEAQRRIPGAKPSVFTNGDFLDHDSLHILVSIPVVYLRVTLYPVLSEIFDAPQAGRIISWLQKKELTSFNWKISPVRQGLGATTTIDKTTVEIIAPEIGQYNWRGGTAPQLQGRSRTLPCHMTTHSASIDFRGNLKMCCNIYPDVEQHKKYVMGNISESPFSMLWNSEKMAALRNAHTNAHWGKSPVCAMCSHQLPESQTMIL